MLAITAWCLPFGGRFTAGFRSFVQPYMVWSGLFQNWDMFAPTPLMLNTYVEAEVIFHNGTVRTWDFPRMEKLSLFDRYLKERYRKFAVDNVRNDEHSALWPDVARFIARANNEASNPPVAVVLYRYWSQIKPPLADGTPQSDPWVRYRFFLYAVKPGDLDP